MQFYKKARKAFMPVIVSAIIAALSVIGITSGMTVKEAVTAIVSSLFVYLAPNDAGQA